MKPLVRYQGRSVTIDMTVEVDEPVIVGDDLEGRWEPDDYDEPETFDDE